LHWPEDVCRRRSAKRQPLKYSRSTGSGR
jgi:hypothetical protein